MDPSDALLDPDSSMLEGVGHIESAAPVPMSTPVKMAAAHRTVCDRLPRSMAATGFSRRRGD
jgi:hypothetical protein